MKHYFSTVFSLILFASTSSILAEEFKIEFEWDPNMEECFSNHSPEIQLFNVPEGTKKLSVRMVDEDNPYNHGGGKMKYNRESSIPAGTLKFWKGPCPPSQHTYSFIVKAKGGEKAKGKYSQKYPQ